MTIKKTVLLIGLVAVISTYGCLGGSHDYIKPDTGAVCKDVIEKEIDYNIDEVWRAAIDYIGKTFFVIDQLAKDSYFINLSFSTGNPPNYIDCGMIYSRVKNARGERTYYFAAASPHQIYELVDRNILHYFDRSISLNGKANILLSKVTQTKTAIRVNIRYIVNKTVKYQLVGATYPGTYTGTLAFNSCGSDSDQRITCISKNVLEKDIIDGIISKLEEAK